MKKSNKNTGLKVFLSVLISVILVIVLGITNIIPYFAVIPDMIEVGIDYISLDRYKEAPSKKEILTKLNETDSIHPFIYADKTAFELIKKEFNDNFYSDYTLALKDSVIDNANALLDEKIYPVQEYVLDEEDSILPISREEINRMVILGCAWQMTGDDRYAEKAVKELKKVCSYDDWCTSHFLATAEMALAVSVGYDWFFDYLSQDLKDTIAQTVFEYAVKPALSKNYLKNWFTWSKNNWNSICYNGIGIACMTFADYFPEEASEFLAMCYKNMPIAFANFTPDGVYAEGPGYSQSGMNSIVTFIATSKNYFGTDFGMSEIDGFRELGHFPAYITTPTGVFNYGDNKDRMCFSPVLHWYATEYDSPLLAVYQMWDMPEKFNPDTSENTERNGSGREDALSLLWYNRSYTAETADFRKEPLVTLLNSDSGQELVLMRSAYLDKDATFAGIKAGYNFINHGDLDIGTFVFDAKGERWAEELGPAGYDSPSYFVNTPAGGRWKSYCKRAEGQNTLVINPDMTLDDQYVLAECKFTEHTRTTEGGKCTLDMTDAYRMNGATEVTRKFELYNDYSALRITDTVKCLIKSDIYWFMHTKADIEISEDGKKATLTIGDKQMTATCLKDGVFSVMNAEKLGGKYEYDDDYSDIKKLTVHIEGVKSAEIEITIE